MKRTVCILLGLCCLLAGCQNPYSSSYVSVKPYEKRVASSGSQSASVSDYQNLYTALGTAVAEGQTKCAIHVAGYDPEKLEADMDKAIEQLLRQDPVASYAVGRIDYELGTSGGQNALAVQIHYVHDRVELLKIKQVQNMEQANKALFAALNECDMNIVLKIQDYENVDFVQLVEDYALENPHQVMELPQVAVNIYPDSGPTRVVELRFFYETSRDSLKAMQEEVQPVFTSAALYVSGQAKDLEKYTQLYSFLMKRYDYRLDSSITPAYSLLRHGVGDSKAFAVVYSGMCRQADLECRVVSGTYEGQSRSWNIICDEGRYYHLDLLGGGFAARTDDEMDGYVWDYSAYPVCV